LNQRVQIIYGSKFDVAAFVFEDAEVTAAGSDITLKLKLILKFIKRIGKLLPVYRESFFCSAVLTPQHYHWYATTRFALPDGS